MADIADPDAVTRAFEQWSTGLCTHSAGFEVERVIRLTGGMDNFVYALTLGAVHELSWPRQVVLRIRPSVSGFDHLVGESRIQHWCYDHGYPAAAVLATIDASEWALGHPAQVTAFVQGENVLDAIKTRPWRLRQIVGAMAARHSELHHIDIQMFPTDIQRRSITEHRLTDVERQIAHGHHELVEPLRRVRAILTSITAAPSDIAVCHGDFHPLNVLVDLSIDADAMTVIHWTDATIDDRHADLARTITLLRVAAVAGGSRVERLLLRVIGPLLASNYLRAYKRIRTVNDDRLRAFGAVHLLSGLALSASLANPDIESASAGLSFDTSIIAMIHKHLEGAFTKSERILLASTPSRV